MTPRRSILFACLVPLIAASAGAQERMTSIAKQKMTTAQQEAADKLLKSRGAGALAGPFVPLLRSPELMNRLQYTGEYLRFQNHIGRKLTEFVILLTARAWTQQYEFHAHEPLAAQVGIPPEIIQAVAEGRRPPAMDADEETAYAFFTELRENQGVSDATYARALGRLGEQGIVDMTTLIGYYTTLAMIMNVARAPLPDGAKPPLRPFPDN